MATMRRRRCRLTFEEPELQYLKHRTREKLESSESTSCSTASKPFPSTVNSSPLSKSRTVTELNTKEGEKSKVFGHCQQDDEEKLMKTSSETSKNWNEDPSNWTRTGNESPEMCGQELAFNTSDHNDPTDEKKVFDSSCKIKNQKKAKEFLVHDFYDAAPVRVNSRFDIKSDFKDENIEDPTERRELEHRYETHGLSSKHAQKVKMEKEEAEAVVTAGCELTEENVQASFCKNEDLNVKQSAAHNSKAPLRDNVVVHVLNKKDGKYHEEMFRKETTDQYFQLKPLDVEDKDEDNWNTKKFETLLPERQTTLCIKNVNYRTTENALKQHFGQYGDVYDVAIPKIYDPNHREPLQSLGYAYVQYFRFKDASKALIYLNDTFLDHRRLFVMPASKSLVTESSDTTNIKRHASKLLVKNIPYQATEKHIDDLFRLFGMLKSVNFPKSLTGKGENRGFAFIEYWSASPAKEAFQALSKGTRFFNRWLVIEMAFEDKPKTRQIKKSSSETHIEQSQLDSTKTGQEGEGLSPIDMERMVKNYYALFYGKHKKRRIRETKIRYKDQKYLDLYFNYRNFLTSIKSFSKIVEEDEEDC